MPSKKSLEDIDTLVMDTKLTIIEILKTPLMMITMMMRGTTETVELDLDGQGGKIFLRVLLNLVMHNYPTLVSGALQLLFRHFSQRQEVLLAFKQVQLLVTTSDVENYKQIKSDLDDLRNMVEKSELWVYKVKHSDEPKKKKKTEDSEDGESKEGKGDGDSKKKVKQQPSVWNISGEQVSAIDLDHGPSINKHSAENYKKIKEILIRLSKLCVQETAEPGVRKPRRHEQRLLRNMSAHQVILELLQIPYEKNDDIRMHELMKLAHEFLQHFCLGNQQNQILLHQSLELFLTPGLLEAQTVQAIFQDNVQLCNEVTQQVVQHFVHCIETHGRHVPYLKFLQTLVKADEKYIKKCQEMVMAEVKSAYINFLNHCYIDTEVEMKEIYTSNHMWTLFENFLVDMATVSNATTDRRHADVAMENYVTITIMNVIHMFFSSPFADQTTTLQGHRPLIQSRQPIFVKLLQGSFRVSHSNWLSGVQKFNVETCIRTLADIAKTRGIAIPVDLDSQVNLLFEKSQNVMQKAKQWMSVRTSKKETVPMINRDYKHIIEGLQEIVNSLERQLCTLVQAELSVLVDVLHCPEQLFPTGSKCEISGFISRLIRHTKCLLEEKEEKLCIKVLQTLRKMMDVESDCRDKVIINTT
ncbi:hypothetical protein KUTeg_020180 [Tegillarca granosa]|uniref:RIH domain-containing protein n=1 Tax=Tegillarca granosa TaxID=220873 RepID=A0ABQ9E722_TEGGR|nr:hypothetical protein KUTeg_020180 [Tegillarca granosa]